MDSVLLVNIVSTLVHHPYLLTIAIVFISLALIAFVSLKMKDQVVRVIDFFTAFKTDVNDIRDEVKTIRHDQIISNQNRQEMKEKIDELTERMDNFSKKGKELKKDVDYLMNFHVTKCLRKDAFLPEEDENEN